MENEILRTYPHLGDNAMNELIFGNDPRTKRRARRRKR